MRLTIDEVRLKFQGLDGHEHRTRSVVRHAMELLSLRLRIDVAAGRQVEQPDLSTMSVPCVTVNMATMSDEAVAEKLADAMYSALHMRWQEGSR